MNATPATAARQITVAKKVNRPTVRPAWTSETGKVRTVRPAKVRTVRPHTCSIDVVIADLPGDRTIGNCWCGQQIDTGTFNEREGISSYQDYTEGFME